MEKNMADITQGRIPPVFLLIIVFTAVSCLTTKSFAQAEEQPQRVRIAVPDGKAPVVDGKVSAEEYEGAHTIDLLLPDNSSAAIRLVTSGGWLFIACDIEQPYEFVNEVQFLWSGDGKSIDSFGFNPYMFFSQPRYNEQHDRTTFDGRRKFLPVESAGGWTAKANTDSKNRWQAELQISLSRLGVTAGSKKEYFCGFVVIGSSMDTTACYPDSIVRSNDPKRGLAAIVPASTWPDGESIARAEKEAASFDAEFKKDKFFRTMSTLAQRQAKAGKFKDLHITIDQMEKQLPGTPAIPYFRGLMREREGKLKAAIADFREAISRCPGLHPVYREIVSLYLTKVKDRDAAKNALKEYVEAFPGSPRPLVYAGMVYSELGDVGAARAALEAAYGLRKDDIEILKRLMACYIENPDDRLVAKAVDLIDRYAASHPKDAGAQAERAFFLAHRLYRFSDAVAAMDNAIKIEPDDPSLHVYRGQFLFWDGRYDEAVKTLEKVVGKITAPQLKPYAAGLLEWARQYVEFAAIEKKKRSEEAKRDDLPRVKLITDRGEIILELFEDDAPNTVANFISLAEKKFYDGTRFHSVKHGAYAQGGDPNSRDGNPDNDGFGGPGYTIRDESSPRRHFRGTITTAKGSEPHSAGSQFIITLVTMPEIDGKNTSFGRVIAGLDVLGRLRRGDYLKEVRIIRKRDHGYQPDKFEGPRKSDPFWQPKKK
ncbi:MAG: tetratricopeptide repeat protein [Planctomycetota bacterium]|nr:MAG: tetratricopeptide repeat protein [Planctomycetota bacterium]